MASTTGYGPSRKESGNKWSRLLFDGNKYEIRETNFFGIHPQVRFKRRHFINKKNLNRDKAITERNEETFAELIQFLDDKSLSLIMREPQIMEEKP